MSQTIRKSDYLVITVHANMHRRYDVAIVDLPESECSLALCHSMGVPVIGFSAASPVGAELEALSK